MKALAGPALVGVLALGVYAATLSPNLAAAHDAVAYMNLIDGPELAFHPHHLLFAPLAQLWIAALWRLGVTASSSELVALLDACAGAAGLALVYALLRHRAELRRALAAAATLCVGSSFGFWFYSVSVEVYLLPLTLILAALYVLGGRDRVALRFAAAGGLHALAVLFHQLHVLFLPAALWAAWRAAQERRGGLVSALAAHAAVFTPIVLGAYAAVLWWVQHVDSAEGALRYVASYALGGEYWYPPSAASAGRVFVGAGRSLVGGHFLFALPELRAPLAAALPGQGLADEVFLVRGLAAGLVWMLIAVSLALGPALLALAIGGARRCKDMAAPARALFELAAVWLASYAVFFVFWVPHNVEFWIPQAVAFWLLLACAWSAAGPGAAGAFTALGVVLAAVNYAGSIRPVGDLANDYYYVQAQRLAARSGERDVIVVGSRWLLPSYLERFAHAPVLSLTRALRSAATPVEAVASVRAALERALAEGGSVWVAHDARDPERELREQLGEDGQRELRRLWADHPPRAEVPAQEQLPPLYVIPAPASSARP